MLLVRADTAQEEEEMRRSGQQPVPTALKILRGNPGHQRIDDAREPKIPLAPLIVPEDLDEEGIKAWHRDVPILFAAGLATPADWAALTAYCRKWSEWVKVNRKLRETGPFVIRKGIPMRHPLASALEAIEHQLRAYFVEFGMTPGSRTRIRVDAPQPKSKVDSFREKHGG